MTNTFDGFGIMNKVFRPDPTLDVGPTTTTLDGFGISIALPNSWDGRIMNRGTLQRGTEKSASGPIYRDAAGGRTSPVVHIGNFALPPNRGDFGSGAADIMGPGHLLIVLNEFGPESVGTALFAPTALPTRLDPTKFSPNALQHRLPGQLGWQHFFTDGGRAFCLFVILGSERHARKLCDAGSTVLSRTRIRPR
ncbi:MAG: hypothetical protein JST73_07285 [Actinobacteria bacterium]|nr:hypothetical protein [Actinomycetota bacterium]